MHEVVLETATLEEARSFGRSKLPRASVAPLALRLSSWSWHPRRAQVKINAGCPISSVGRGFLVDRQRFFRHRPGRRSWLSAFQPETVRRRPEKRPPLPQPIHAETRHTMNRILLLALLSLVLTFCPAADLMSASITYNLQSYPTQQSGLTLSGTITTDGAIGTSLSSADITNWDIIISGAAGYPLTTANSSANLLGGFTTTALGQIEFAKPTTNTNTGIVFEIRDHPSIHRVGPLPQLKRRPVRGWSRDRQLPVGNSQPRHRPRGRPLGHRPGTIRPRAGLTHTGVAGQRLPRRRPLDEAMQ